MNRRNTSYVDKKENHTSDDQSQENCIEVTEEEVKHEGCYEEEIITEENNQKGCSEDNQAKEETRQGGYSHKAWAQEGCED